MTRIVLALLLVAACKDKPSSLDKAPTTGSQGSAQTDLGAIPRLARPDARPRPERPPDLPDQDLDHDGTVTDSERVAARTQRLGRTLLLLDTNMDGKVSVAELTATKLRYFMFAAPFAVDTDRDGFISVEELDAALEQRLEEMRVQPRP